MGMLKKKKKRFKGLGSTRLSNSVVCNSQSASWRTLSPLQEFGGFFRDSLKHCPHVQEGVPAFPTTSMTSLALTCDPSLPAEKIRFVAGSKMGPVIFKKKKEKKRKEKTCRKENKISHTNVIAPLGC